MIVNMRKNKID